MLILRRLLLLLSPRRRRERAREFEEELRADLALAAEDALDSGRPPREAELAARRELGNLTRAREEVRAVWLPGWDHLAQDLRYALRGLRRAPGFSTVAVLSLALGIGFAAALFSLVDGVVLRPLAYRDPGKLLYLREIVPPMARVYPSLPVNLQHFGFWRDRARSFSRLAAVINSPTLLTDGSEPEAIDGARVTAGFWEMLGITPQLGRPFLPEDEQPGHDRVVIVTDSLWRRRLHADPEAPGKPILLNGTPYTIVGVLPPSFRFPKNDDLGELVGLGSRTEVFRPVVNGPDAPQGWDGDYDYIVIGRLRSGVTEAAAAAEMEVLQQRIVAEHAVERGLHIKVRGLQDVVASPVRTALGVLLAAVLVLLLIVCVNLANLLLARGSARAREYALRVALGAGRARLVAHALLETILLSVAGAVLGTAGAKLAVARFAASSRVHLPRLDEVRVDGRVLLFAFGLSLACGLLFGLIPALRLAGLDPQHTLRTGGYTLSPSGKGLRLREWLAGSEVALSALLLVLAGLLINSLLHVLHVDKGFEEKTVLVRIGLPSRYATPAQRNAFFDLAVERFRALPGVRSAAFISRPPLTGESNVNHIQINGADAAALDPATRQMIMVNVRFAGPDYFATLGIPLLEGRGIEPGDRNRSVAVVSKRLAEKLWPGRSALGRRISTGSTVGDADVVGVVGDVHSTRLEQDPTLMVYTPFWKIGFLTTGYLAIRGPGDAGRIASAARAALRGIDPALPAPAIQPAGALVLEATAQRRFQVDLATAFAASALLLALLGTYGVVAYGVSLRRREMGVRIALGANRGDLRRLVLRQGLRPVMAGLAIGLVAALAAGRMIQSLLFGIAPADAPTLVAVAVVLAGAGVLACLAPAWSAGRLDPARVLREE